MPVEVHAVPAEQLLAQVEAAAYYVVAEALANVQRHPGAGRIVVRVTTDERCLVITVVDDGVGGADEEGAGCAGSPIAVEALGGRLTLESPAVVGDRIDRFVI